MVPEMTQCYLSIGSNVDPFHHIYRAVQWLERRFVLLRCSPIYRSPAAGFEGDDFLNLAVSIKTHLDLEIFCAQLKAYEYEHGRSVNEPRYSSKIIDIDIVTFGDRVGCFGTLVLPRPELFYRPYVLKPIVDIAGHVSLPKSRAKYACILTKKLASEPDFLNALEPIRPFCRTA